MAEELRHSAALAALYNISAWLSLPKRFKLSERSAEALAELEPVLDAAGGQRMVLLKAAPRPKCCG
ncbi:MAG: hypothetical protein EXR51_08275 [Dehalococcoidia bacterium]|nr:hypothetical protein [Dehalococcoidia bacterium]